jgi:hypothetical protein
MGAKPGILVTAGELARAYLAALGGAAALDGNPAPPLPGVASIRAGLRECCVSGTAYALHELAPDLSILGKTGTGQTADGAPVGVFVGLTPADAPQRAIVAAVLGGRGSDAARLVGEVLGRVTNLPPISSERPR